MSTVLLKYDELSGIPQIKNYSSSVYRHKTLNLKSKLEIFLHDICIYLPSEIRCYSSISEGYGFDFCRWKLSSVSVNFDNSI